MYKEFYTKHSNKIFILLLVLFNALVFAICVKINIFRYNNFDFGKFDLGNMSQMAWYTLNGKFMYLTDYFGTNLPRWAMSHVDPILVIFLPIFALFPHSLTLVFGQIVLVLSTSLVIYKLASFVLKSNLAAFLLSMSFLFYPAVGFLLAWTGYHGVTVVIPFFILAFYVFERMHWEKNFSKQRRIVFWVMIVLTLMGKEQLALYMVMYGVFIAIARKNLRYGLYLISLGLVWFVISFMIIIPHYAKYRVDGFIEFSKELSIDQGLLKDVGKENYFLSRYSEFGDSYLGIVLGIVLNPAKTTEVFFGGDKLTNFRMTLEPLLYAPLFAPLHLLIAIPDFMINYLTTESGIGTAEVYNHRISMIVPILFISTIYFISYLSRYLHRFFNVRKSYTVILISGFILLSTIGYSRKYENPIYLWFFQSVQRRLASSTQVFAIENEEKWLRLYKQASVGEQVRIPHMDTKDRNCAAKIVASIPETKSITGPDYLGAHLSLRETYAIFPALYTKADVVIADIFSQKVFRILDIDRTLVNDLVGDLIKNPNYELTSACGNLFVFENIGPHDKTQRLPIQEYYRYQNVVNYPISMGLSVVDYDFPKLLVAGSNHDARFVYTKEGDDRLDDYFAFVSLVNLETDELYQVANIPSFGLSNLADWSEGLYYEEQINLAVPKFVEPGKYRAFVGITNQIKTRSVFLGEVEIK